MLLFYSTMEKGYPEVNPPSRRVTTSVQNEREKNNDNTIHKEDKMIIDTLQKSLSRLGDSFSELFKPIKIIVAGFFDYIIERNK